MSQQVVPIETGTGDGWSAFETSMRAVPVVVVEPARQVLDALIGVFIGTGISPFA